MPINPIQIPQKFQEQTALDKIATGIGIINSTLGTALAIPKYLQEKSLGEAQQQHLQSEVLKNVAESNRLNAEAEALGRKKDVLSDYNNKLFEAYNKDYKIVPTPSKNSISVPIGDHVVYYDPKEEKDTNFSKTNEIRDSFLKQSEYFQDVSNKYAQILKYSKDPSGIGDIGIVRSFIRMTDPRIRMGGVDEAETVANAEGLDQNVKTAAIRLLTGQALGNERSQIRQQFMQAAKDTYTAQREIHSQRENTYKDLAKSFGIDSKLAVPDVTLDSVIAQYSKNNPNISDTTKVLNNITYQKVNGGWQRVK